MTRQSGSDKHELRTRSIYAIPIINRYMQRIGLQDILSSRMGGGGIVPNTSCLMILLRNILTEREPIYGMGKWASSIDPSLLGITEDQADHVNDDRMGRTLDMLFDADRGSMLVEIVKNVIEKFGICMDEFHNDSTTITFSGNYEDADGSDKRGKETARITYGHNKDHRPDLKQLLWTLTVSADHSVPVHYMALDGNTQDTKTHIDTWNFLRELSGRSDFVYVADSKLCSRGNMKYIDENHGKFITVLPATRSETLWFHDYIQDHRVDWKDGFVRRRSKGDIRFSVFDSPIPSSEGFRIVWVWSSQKEDLDSDTRDRSIRRSVSDLESIESALQRRHMKKERIINKAEEAIKGVPYIKYEIREEHVETFRKSGRGRPSAGSTYRRIENPVYHISWSIHRDAIEKDSRSDGIFPLITNCMDTEATDVLSRYKYQPMLEKRYEQVKSVYDVMPVLFKSIARIEGFLFVYFIAMIIQSLIERDVRIAMADMGIKSIPLYSEERECSSPTCYRIFSAFDNMQVHHLISNGKETERFYTDISDVQKLILSLLGIPEEEFRPE